MKIGFVRQEISHPHIKEYWQDGLATALNIIGKDHIVTYHEPWDTIENVDVILYHEAPCTFGGNNSHHYNKVRTNPIKKALLFAGGAIRKEWVSGFDILFLESKINEKECDDLGISWHHAFGINDKIFKYEKKEKMYDGMLAGTCASWKRQWLIGEALGDKGLVCGKNQESDPQPFIKCKEFGTLVLPEQRAESVASLLNQSFTCVNPCDYWGGGQRATLEAMACGVPVICCTDSPKNREFVEASGFGRVVEPNAQDIKRAVEELKANQMNPQIGVDYIQSKWTSKIYAKQILEGVRRIIEG